VAVKVKAHVLLEIKVDADAYVTGAAGEDKKEAAGPTVLAFTSLQWHAGKKLLFCGLTRDDNDLIYTYDPATEEFRSLDFKSMAEEREIKIHRSFALDKDGTIWSATAGILDIDARADAPGGRILHIFPESGKIEAVGRPCPHDYIQTITLDSERRIIYGYTFPVFRFFRHDIESGKSRDFGYMGSIGHIHDLDDDGGFWGLWSFIGHFLFRYDPDKDEIEYTRLKVPFSPFTDPALFPGAGPVDAMINGRDGFLYIGTTNGCLYRFDPRKRTLQYLGKPTESGRLPGLALGKNNLIYGVAGMREPCLFAFDPKKDTFHILGVIRDDERGAACHIPHDLTIADDGRVFVGETDNPERAGYLWECVL
jgi:sugar lactone lactonase YvrE